MLKHSVSAIALGIALGLAPAAFAQEAETQQQPAAEGQQQGGAEVIVVQPEGGEQTQTTTQPAEGETTTQPVEVQTTTQPAEGETTTEPAEGQQMEVETVPADQQGGDQTQAQTQEGQEGQPVPGQIFEQSPDQFLASTLMDGNVQSAEGENIGDVTDIIVSQSGQVQGVVIGVGGFLGIGQKDVAVQMNQITIQQDPNNPDNLTFVLNMSREELENAPEFQTQQDQQAEQDAATGAAGTTGAGGTVTTTDPAATGGAVTTDPAATGGATTTTTTDPAAGGATTTEGQSQ